MKGTNEEVQTITEEAVPAASQPSGEQVCRRETAPKAEKTRVARDSGVELLKLFAMLAICLFHAYQTLYGQLTYSIRENPLIFRFID